MTKLNVLRLSSRRETHGARMKLPEKKFHTFLDKLKPDNMGENGAIPFIRKIFLKNEALDQFQNVLHAACNGHKIVTNDSNVKDLLSFLYNVYTGDLDVDVKVQAFKSIFEACASSCKSERSYIVLQFFTVLCHLLGLEQKVQFQWLSKPEDPPKSVINGKDFEEAFGVTCSEPNGTSYKVVNSLIDVLNQCSCDLNCNLGEMTHLQWFQSFILVPVKTKNVKKIHFEFFCACSDLNTAIIEKNLARILTYVLSQPCETFENEEYVKTFHHFMEYMLQMHSKLQRVQKFVGRLLTSIQNAKSKLPLKCVLSDNIANEFSNLITLLPSVQCLSFMDELLNTLSNDCVKTIEESKDYVNTLLIQVTCALLSSFLCGVRVLSHTTPEGILKSFLEKILELKKILGRFGKALLVRIHDREIVQPFLNLCFYWGEFELLILYYAPAHAEQLTNKDISPTDLSTLHSYLTGEEWNVLAERVSNFGAVQCYQLFLKLILQKLRTLQLRKVQTSVSGEGTSKYILTLLTSELYKHDIIEELTPEDVHFLLGHLTQKQSRMLLDKMYTQVLDLENGSKFLTWVKGSVLLENRMFVVLSLVIIFNKFGAKLSTFSKRNGTPDVSFRALTLEFVNESYKLNEGELAELVENLNQLLNDGGVKFDKDLKTTEFEILLDIMKCLPLVYMSKEITPLSLTGVTFLAVVFSEVENFLKPLLHLMYKLLMKTGKTEAFTNFHLGAGVKWLLLLDSSLGELRNNLMKLLLKKGISTENGRNELREFLKGMRKRKFEDDSKALEYQITLYQDLGKSWAKSKIQCEENQEIANYRRKLSKRIRKTLEKQNEMETPTVDAETLLAAYTIELIRVIKKKNEDDIVRLVQLNFEKYFDVAVSKLKGGAVGGGCHTFLTTVLIHFPTLKPHLKKTTLKRIWNALKNQPKVDWKLLLRISDEQEFKFFMKDLIKMWEVFEKSKSNKMDLNVYFNIWREFAAELNSGDKTEKKKSYEKYLKRLFLQFAAGMAIMNNLTAEEMVELLDFLRFCISTDELVMTSSMIDASFDLMYNYEYRDPMSTGVFQKVFESCVTSASWLLSRSFRTKDKIHNIFQLFTKLLDALARRSVAAENTPEEELLALASCSHNMEKWASKMIYYSKDFSRMSVYFIAALVSSFVKFTILEAVKAPLVNCIYKFLRISDSHNIAHLSMALNPGNQQVFNGIYETYNRYYKFTGKV